MKIDEYNKESITIDDLKNDLMRVYDFNEYIRFNTPIYRSFHDNLTQFIYDNHLGNEPEWKIISENLLYKSSQYLIRGEADVILYNLELLKRKILSRKNEAFWEYIHPILADLIFDKFYSRQYADCVETSFKEINSRLKNICIKLGYPEKDGSDLMNFIFSVNNPILKFEDTSYSTGHSVQQGYMQIFAGAMTGIRNPKAHCNMQISRDDAIKRIVFASLLMDKIDEALRFSGIKENK